MQVDLLLIGADAAGGRGAAWELGRVHGLPVEPARLAPALDMWLATTTADCCLFWSPRLGAPKPSAVGETLQLPGDIWHAGLRLGTAGLPILMDCVHPVWMLNRDPDPTIVASSWRVSLDACLARVEVLRQLGGLDPRFDTLAGAGLDMGLRWIRRGAIVRHVPALAGSRTHASKAGALPVHDEVRLIRQHYGAKWMGWCLWRGVAMGFSRSGLIRAARRVRREGVRPMPEPYRRTSIGDEGFEPSRWHNCVSVIIPTLDRYSYLRCALAQLRGQTIRPKEIIVIDQTPAASRDASLAADFADLPLTVIQQDALGQCTARNQGIAASTGELLLFMDDDTDEIPADFIESLLRTCEGLGADLVASSVEEAGAGPIPPDYKLMRVVDIFPVGTLARRRFFEHGGLFDFAFDRGARADADVAMRGYLAGGLMVLNPAIRIAHWRASRGGLRVHGARVITSASSKVRLRHRDVPSHTEIYLVMRHFAPRQIREMVVQRVVGTLVSRGRLAFQMAKAVVGLVCLPQTLWRLRVNERRARAMMAEFPQIPPL